MKPERELSPIQGVVDPLKIITNTSGSMDFTQSSPSSGASSLTQDWCSPMGSPIPPSISPLPRGCIRPQDPNSPTFLWQCHTTEGDVPTSSQSFFNMDGVTDNMASYQEDMTDYQHNLTQFHQNMSQLQQDMSLARISAEGDTSLQSVYLERLQELVPWVPKDEQLPKLQLVQAVIDYINLLQEQLAAAVSPCATSANGPGVFQDFGNYYDDTNANNSAGSNGGCAGSRTAGDSSVSSTSCYDSSPSSSSLSQSPPSSSASPSSPPSVHSHLLNHLQEKQMVNELQHLQMVQRTSGEEIATQQMVDGYINQHQIINDLRQKRLKDSTSARQHMASPGGSGGVIAPSEHHQLASDATCDIMSSTTTPTAHYKSPASPTSHYQSPALLTTHYQPPSSPTAHYQSLYQHYQGTNHPVPVHSIFPFPAPPSPQTIKAARKKKFQLKRQQELQQQQHLQQQLLLQHQQQQNCHYQPHQQHTFSAIES